MVQILGLQLYHSYLNQTISTFTALPTLPSFPLTMLEGLEKHFPPVLWEAAVLLNIFIISLHTKIREFCSLGIYPKICPKEPTVNTNPNNQSQSTVIPKDTVAPCPYVYRHSGVRTVWYNRARHCIVLALPKQLSPYNPPPLTPLGVPKGSTYTHMGREQDIKVPQPTIHLFDICMFSNLKPHTASKVAKLTRHTRNKLSYHD